MRSGLFWGVVGAIRELIERICETASDWGGSSTATPAHFDRHGNTERDCKRRRAAGVCYRRRRPRSR